ncbi:MAG: rod shape-determining protein RodA [Myxococcota bacterium]
MATLVRGFKDQFDWALFVSAAAIAVIGVVNLYSATSAAGPALSDLYIQQIYWLTLGTGVAVVVAAIDYRHYERHGWVAYGAGIVLLLLVFLLGKTIRGSTRWMEFGSFTLQPSELMKIFLIIALAKYLHNDPKTDGRTLKDLVIPGLILAVPMTLILLQPDLGTAMILAFIFGTIMVLTKLKLRSLVTLATAFILSAPLTWTYLLQSYQKDRLIAFMNPDVDLEGIGYHAHQSKVAIGSGGVAGKGFLEGTQNQHGFLPDQYSDFPFSVWAEEQGLLGVLFMLGLYMFIILWGLKIASQAKDRFGAVIAVGVSAMIFWHAMINVSMVSGVLPVVGMTLPLFSYGGSSVLTIMIGVGLLMNVSMRRFHF